MRSMVKALAAMLKYDEGKMIKWRFEAVNRSAKEARVLDLKAMAECRAEVAEREAEAARAVMLETVTELEKASGM